MSTFKIGDVVKLRSGSPGMTITRLTSRKDPCSDADRFLCDLTYFEAFTCQEIINIPVEALVLAKDQT